MASLTQTHADHAWKLLWQPRRKAQTEYGNPLRGLELMLLGRKSAKTESIALKGSGSRAKGGKGMKRKLRTLTL